MADEENVTRALVDLYGREDIVTRLGARLFLRASGLARLPRTARILDCGCGLGRLLTLLRSRGFENLAGLDASGEMAEAARRLTGLPVVEGDVLELDRRFGEGEFDAVVVLNLLHHLDGPGEWGEALAHIRKVLNNGGTAVFREPHPTPFVKLLDRLSRIDAMVRTPLLGPRLATFVEERPLLEPFLENWPAAYRSLMSESGLRVEKELTGPVHRLLVCRVIT